MKEYKTDEITVTWEPDVCIHSTHCWKELGEVFKPKSRPWVHMQGASADRIIEQVKRCPSQALKVIDHRKSSKQPNMEQSQQEFVRVEIIPNGPMAVHQNCAIAHPNGTIEQKPNKVFFCRCGASSNKPYCDGSHKKIEFQG